MKTELAVRRGSVHITADAYDTYFAGTDAVIVLIRDSKLMIMPVAHVAAGGSLLKIKNARGDRVVIASDVFAANDLEAWEAERLPAHWDSEACALVTHIEK